MIIEFNRMVCAEGGNQHQCYGIGKVESALHSAFYPGSYPYRNGGVARLAGAVAYFITMSHAFFDGNKRTALVSSITFMRMNSFQVENPIDTKTGLSKKITQINQVLEKLG